MSPAVNGQINLPSAQFESQFNSKLEGYTVSEVNIFSKGCSCLTKTYTYLKW